MSVEFASEDATSRGLNLQYNLQTYTPPLTAERVVYSATKRLFDLVVALPGTALLLPTALLVKIAYLSTGDFAPIFYTQTRIGKHGKTFRIYKFRTMSADADAQLTELLKDAKYQQEWAKHHKLSHDPRITKVGKFIRKSSIDEMPQFVNILLGHISLIGPRPLVPGELVKHGGNEPLYHSVKPGLTGWWAVNGRSATDYQARLALEYYYIQHNSLALDFKIFCKTFSAVLKANGAK